MNNKIFFCPQNNGDDHVCGPRRPTITVDSQGRRTVYLDGVKNYIQKFDHTCGPTVLKVLAEVFGLSLSQDKLEALLTPDHSTGSLTTDMVKVMQFCQAFSVIAKTRSRISDILACIDNGFPVAVNYFCWKEEEGHFAVVAGYRESKKGRELILHDPSYGTVEIVAEEFFKKYWHAEFEEVEGWMLVPLSRGLENGACHTLREGTCEQFKAFLDQVA